jgi:ubiquinone/menaquinone biosynthesis C-methylase UbiE
VAAYGGRVIFGVKFHPELMTIESCYRDISLYLRQHNVIGVSKNFMKQYDDALLSLKVDNIRKYQRSVNRFLQAYIQEGASGDTVLDVVKGIKSRHRSGVDLDKLNLPVGVYKRKRDIQL